MSLIHAALTDHTKEYLEKALDRPISATTYDCDTHIVSVFRYGGHNHLQKWLTELGHHYDTGHFFLKATNSWYRYDPAHPNFLSQLERCLDYNVIPRARNEP
jgi:hypothetical protein